MTNLAPQSRFFIAGHKGLVGSACVRALKDRGFENVLCRDRKELDLREQGAVRKFFESECPDYVIFAAGKVGGVGANSTFPVEFLLENLQIQNNLIPAAADFGVKKLIFLGSSCIYPREAKYPLTEDQLLSGPFEPTNEAYALAKVAGIKLCQYYAKQYQMNFISLMPTNLYGPNDTYNLEESHVMPAMILKILKAKKQGQSSVTFWGSGKPLREFLHAEDLADAILLCLEKYNSPEIINVGSGYEVSIQTLAETVCKACDFKGEIHWDTSRPDGIFRKVLDSSKIKALGWRPKRQMAVELQKIAKEVAERFSF